MEYLGCIVLATPHEEQDSARSGPVAMGVDSGDTTPGLVSDAIGDLLPLVGKDEELDGLLIGHNEPVGNIGVHKYRNPAVDDGLGAGLDAGLHIATVERKEE